MQSKLPVIFSLFFKKAHKDEGKKSIKKRDQTECITYSQRLLKVLNSQGVIYITPRSFEYTKALFP